MLSTSMSLPVFERRGLYKDGDLLEESGGFYSKSDHLAFVQMLS